MKKILIKVLNWGLNYDGIEYAPGETVEIEERFFRNDCMGKISEINSKEEKNSNDVQEGVNSLKEEFSITVKELKELSKSKEITLIKTKKDEIFNEAKEKFVENGLDLEEEIKKYLAEKNAEVENENFEGVN